MSVITIVQLLDLDIKPIFLENLPELTKFFH